MEYIESRYGKKRVLYLTQDRPNKFNVFIKTSGSLEKQKKKVL
jgi:hypothetical protein